MNVYKPLRVILFSCDLIRLLFMAMAYTVFPFAEQTVAGGIFPYLVYLSSNALFPLITFFLLLNPAEYRNYLPLYTVGKTIAAVLFYIWAVFSLPYETGFITRENYVQGMILLGGAFCISLIDGFSIFGIWLLNKKLPRTAEPETNGGL